MDSVGMALFGLGILLVLAELLLPGAAAIGLLTLGIGSLLLYRADADLAALWTTGYTLAVVTLVILLAIAIVVLAIRVHRRQVVAGENELIGQHGHVTRPATATEPAYALIQGELWQVRAAQPLQIGQAVRVTSLHGLRLHVAVIEEPDGLPSSAFPAS